MIHLKIEQNNSAIEQVSSTVITKLYELATSGELDLSSNLVGRLHTDATYLLYIDGIRNNYPDLYISSDSIITEP